MTDSPRHPAESGGDADVGSFRANAAAVPADAASVHAGGEGPLELPGYVHVAAGKVRDLYAPLDEGTGAPRDDVLLLVASDRVSAYDHVLASPIPGKGRVLTQLSLWWFEQLADLVPHHVVSTDVPAAVAGRAVLVRRLEMLPVECIARAYLTGSGPTDYQRSGAICGVDLPPGLTEGSRLPAPIFTPTTKADLGAHDEPITLAEAGERVGQARAAQAARLTTAILERAEQIAAPRGILIADTKVEFGVDPAAGTGCRRAADPRGRGVDPGLLAVLAGRAVAAGAAPAQLRQAVRPGLADIPRQRVGPRRPRPAAATAAGGRRAGSGPRCRCVRGARGTLVRRIRPLG